MLPLSVSEKLLLLAGGAQLPASTIKHAAIEELISEGIVSVRIAGRTKRTFYISDRTALDTWLYNRYSINDLGEYIRVLKDTGAGRADLVLVSNDSKAQSKRTYQGFLLNSYTPIQCSLNGQPLTVHPAPGTFHFVYDFEHFVPAADTVVVGIENMENFRHADKLAYLFSDIKPLFVCRYPQEQAKDLIKWLTSIPNAYLHFGDYDFGGINIYLREYRKYLHDRASFFIPAKIEELIARHGNSKLYDRQQLLQGDGVEESIQSLVTLLHLHKKGLEQEALLIYDNVDFTV